MANSLLREPIVVPDYPLHPALGLPRAVVRQRAFSYWFELIFGVAFLAALIGSLLGLVHESQWTPEGIGLSALFAILSPYMVYDGIRNIRRKPCVIVAANGFDDRTGWRPAGPVLWGEVAGMATSSKLVGRRRYPVFVVMLRPGPRSSLVSLSRPPKQVKQVQIPMDHGLDKIIAPAMLAAYDLWRAREGGQI